MSEAEHIYIKSLIDKIKENPNVIDNYRELTNIYVSNRDYDSALSIYNKMLEVFPDDVQALINSGSICFYKKDFEKAISLYLRAIASEPENAAIHYNLGNVYAEIGNFSSALKYYTNAINLGAIQGYVFSAIGILFQDNDDLENAKINFVLQIHTLQCICTTRLLNILKIRLKLMNTIIPHIFAMLLPFVTLKTLKKQSNSTGMLLKLTPQNPMPIFCLQIF